MNDLILKVIQLKKLFRMVAMVGTLMPTLLHAQIFTSQVSVTPTPAIDAVLYDCENGYVSVFLKTPIPNTTFHVKDVQPSWVPVPPPNETGEFLMPDLKKATFYAIHRECESPEYVLNNPCYIDPFLKLNFYATKAGIARGRLDLYIYTNDDIADIDIEKSIDGKNWNFLNDHSPLNDGRDTQHYISFDENPVKGLNYYRAKIIDIEGKVIYSPVRMLYFGDEIYLDEILFPNPNNGNFYLRLRNEITTLQYEIRNVFGHILEKSEIKGPPASLFFFEDKQYSAGFYVLMINTGNPDRWRPLKFEIIY